MMRIERGFIENDISGGQILGVELLDLLSYAFYHDSLNLVSFRFIQIE